MPKGSNAACGAGTGGAVLKEAKPKSSWAVAAGVENASNIIALVEAIGAEVAGAVMKSESPASIKSSIEGWGAALGVLAAADEVPFLMVSLSLPPTALSLVGADILAATFGLCFIFTSSSSS
jgi:hypothetical protein